MPDMADHSLAIRRFETRLALTGLHEDGPPLGREIGRAVRDILPAALGLALEPLLGNRGGVLRIDRVALKVSLGRGDVSAVRLADLLAREIARAVAGRAEGSGPAPRIGAGVAYWPDHAGFAAAYLARRLGLAPAPEWAFPDFRALDLLAPHEAALELLAARPAILAALARLIGPAAAPALAAALPEHAAATLVARLAADLAAGLPTGATAILAEMIAALPEAVEAAPARAAVAAMVKALSTSVSDADEVGVVRRLATLARLAVALVAVRDAMQDWGRLPEAADLVPEMLIHLAEPARSLAQAAIVPLAGAGDARTALAGLIGPPQRRAAIAEPAAPEARQAAEAPRSIASRHAGIGLLIPCMLSHGVPDLLSPAALHRTLAAALGPEGERAARLDPLLAALAPFDPREPEAAFPPVPETLRAVVPEGRREGAAEAEGAAGWAACLTHDFGAGLSGFGASSLDYLRRQFLARPGTLHVAEGRMTLVLDPLPLGIVLRIAGLHGWSGRLPHAGNARLRIEIRED